MNAVPPQPKIYHIAHVDRLPSIVADGFLWCDAEIVRRVPPGTTIGMNGIKQRRLNELHAAQIAAEDAAKKAVEHGMRTLEVEVSGPGSGRESALRALR